MIKYIIFLSFITLISPLYAEKIQPNRGMITVLEAPLLQKTDIKSRVLKYVRKGDIIYIHPKYFTKAPTDKNYDNIDSYFSDEDQLKLYFEPSESLKNDETLADQEEFQPLRKKQNSVTKHFYLTLDELGNRAYIPKRFVKLIYQDEREFLTSVKPYHKDPTDYRLPEPLRKNYPYLDKDIHKYWFSFGAGTQAKQKYPYNGNTNKETFGTQLEFKNSFSWKIHHQNEERMYFGAFMQVLYFENNFDLAFPVFNRKAKERRLIYGIGPYISYDTIRFDPIHISVFQAFLVNFNQHNVFQTLTENDGEERKFLGLSFSSSTGVLIQGKHLLGDYIDVFLGSALQIDLPYKLTSNNNQSSFPAIWSNAENDSLNYSMQASLSLFAGIQIIL